MLEIDAKLADLGLAVEELRGQLANARSNAVRIEMERSATHDRRVKSDEQNDILRGELKALQERIKDLNQCINKMETDIGKLRDEFGNQAVTRVLG